MYICECKEKIIDSCCETIPNNEFDILWDYMIKNNLPRKNHSICVSVEHKPNSKIIMEVNGYVLLEERMS